MAEAKPKPNVTTGAMPKVDMIRDAKILSQAQLDYMRLAQQQNAGIVIKSKLPVRCFCLKK